MAPYFADSQSQLTALADCVRVVGHPGKGKRDVLMRPSWILSPSTLDLRQRIGPDTLIAGRLKKRDAPSKMETPIPAAALPPALFLPPPAPR